MKQVLRAMATDGSDDSFDLSNQCSQSMLGSSSSKSNKFTKVNINLLSKTCYVELSTLSLYRTKAMNSILSGKRGKVAF